MSSEPTDKRELPLNEDRDAARWARDFNAVLATTGKQPLDEGFLIAWFANAMMCGEDTYRWKKERETGVRSAKREPMPVEATNGDEWVLLPVKLAEGLREIVNYEGWQGSYFRRIQTAMRATKATNAVPSATGERPK